MRARSLLILGIVLLAGVGAVGLWSRVPVDPPKPSRAREVLDVCPPVMNSPVAVPPSRLETWQLHAPLWWDMGEPLLACGPSRADETYRLTWWHSFTRFDPYVIRAERSGSDVRVSVSVFHFVDTDSYAYDGLVRLKRVKRMTYAEKRVTQAEWRQLTDATGRADFWTSEDAGCWTAACVSSRSSRVAESRPMCTFVAARDD